MSLLLTRARKYYVDFEQGLELDKKTQGDLWPLQSQLIIMTERDLNFIKQMKEAEGQKIALICGLGHAHGVLKYWDEKFEESDIMESIETKIIKKGNKRAEDLFLKHYRGISIQEEEVPPVPIELEHEVVPKSQDNTESKSTNKKQ